MDSFIAFNMALRIYDRDATRIALRHWAEIGEQSDFVHASPFLVEEHAVISEMLLPRYLVANGYSIHQLLRSAY
jgi:hypothetical protein